MSEMFDRLAKMAAGGVSRRDALRYLGGFLTGGVLAGLTGRARADGEGGGDNNGDEINEICQKYCRQCPKSPASTFGQCMSACKQCLHKNPKGTACGACSATTPFTCCPGGASCCAAAGAAAYCANLGTDAKNCGACGSVCPTAKPTCCAGVCTDTTSDVNNCGACGNVCPQSATGAPTCTNGNCG